MPLNNVEKTKRKKSTIIVQSNLALGFPFKCPSTLGYGYNKSTSLAFRAQTGQKYSLGPVGGQNLNTWENAGRVGYLIS